jgi:hypothetical protein
MKHKYLKGSEVDFDGHPGAILVVKSATSGRVYHLGLDYAGRDKDIEKVGDIIIAHREPINTSEVSGDTHLSQAIQNTARDVSKIIDKKIKETLTITTEALITERGNRYGKFKDGAEIMQSLKDTMRDIDGWNNLTASQKEALDMIQHKIGRILNGDPTYDDSWKDIAGYATLIVNELNGEVK